jgi:creatinine amidohydrolase
MCAEWARLPILRPMRVIDCHWMQLEAYLERDDRIVLPLGSTEQHATLSLGVDVILAQRVAEEAAEPLGIPVLPALAYGVTPYFGAFPGSPSVSAEVYRALLRDLVESLHGQRFKRVCVVNGHGGNSAAREGLDVAVWHDWWSAPRTRAAIVALDPDAAHASFMENFPWTRLEGVTQPEGHKPFTDIAPLRSRPPREVREIIGDGSLGGYYELPDDDMLRIWAIGVEETRAALDQ